MRFSRFVAAAAAAGLAAFAATAQESPPAQDPPAKAEAEPSQRLPDIEQTLNELLQEEDSPAAETPVTSTPEPAPEPAAPAGSEPAAPPQAPPPQATRPAVPASPPSTTPSGPAPPLTRAQIAELDRTVERGRLLVAIARAGLVATQDMLTRLSDPNGAGISGWVAEPAGNSMIVTFYADGEGEAATRKAVYRSTVLGGRVTSREIFLGENRPALTPLQARMAAARASTGSEELRACTNQPFNVLVVPPASATAPMDVYRVSSVAERGHFPLGGHFLTTLAADGSVETRSFAGGCANVDVPATAAGAQPQPVGVTYLLGDLPTEIHMLLSQSVARPLLVVAGDPQRIWLVTGDRIAEVRNTAQR